MKTKQFALSSLITVSNSSGTGFLYSSDLYTYLVTAKHVLYDEQDNLISKEIEVLFQTSDRNDDSVFQFRFNLNKLTCVADRVHDITIVKIAENTPRQDGKNGTGIKYLDGVEQLVKGKSTVVTSQFRNVQTLDNLNIGNDIYIAGYPTSIGILSSPQFDYNKPLLRKGILANVYKENGTIILDCPVYPGTSGAPVMQSITIGFETLTKVIGVVSKYIPYVQKWMSNRDKLVNTEYLNSGFSVATSFDSVLNLINKHEENTAANSTYPKGGFPSSYES